MKKIIYLAIYLAILFNNFFVFANEKDKEAGRSASISYNKITNSSTEDFNRDIFYKKYSIKKILEKYESPLVENVDDFIKTCVNYQIDCYLLPSISGVESTFGRHINPNSYNPFGWDRGYAIFKNFADGIEKVGYHLKNNYINDGLSTIEKIGSRYSESQAWASRVYFFINEFQNEEKKLRLYFEKNEVKL